MNYISKKDILLQKKRGQKKGDNGRLLIIGGSKDYVGALSLAGVAALRTGCDWVTIAAPEKVAWAINCLSPDLVTIKLKGEYISIKHKKKLEQLIDNHTCFLIGNGIGNKSKTIIKQLIKSKKPKVIDADAIKSLSLEEINNAIITPHKKEYELLKSNSKIFNIKDNVIILKGPTDKIITKTKTLLNRTGNPGMTKAGTGDVLAGIAAGFLAQKLPKINCAINATYINGNLGDILLKKKKGYFYIASDLINELT